MISKELRSHALSSAETAETAKTAYWHWQSIFFSGSYNYGLKQEAAAYSLFRQLYL